MITLLRRVSGRVRTPRGLAIVALAFGWAALAALPAAGQQVTLLHIGDTHSHLAAWGPKDAALDGTLGGLPKAAAVVAAARAADPMALFVHAGDFMEGDLFFNEYFGVPELRILKDLGLDAMAIGNHEFRFKPAFLAQVFQTAWGGPGPAVLGTNIDPHGDAIGPWISPAVVKEANGVKIGFFGLTPPDAAMEDLGPTLEILSDLEGVSQAAVEALIGQGAQVIVCLSHNGMDVARHLAVSVAGIDVIVNGHDNAVLEQPEAVARPGGGTTRIVSAGHLYRWVGRLRLSVAGGSVDLVDYSLLSVDESVVPSPAVQLAVDLLKAGIVAQYGDVYHEPLGRAKGDIDLDADDEKSKRDTPLGNLFTDAYRAWTGTDVALEPFAYMGDPLPGGLVVGADLFRAMSYGNYKASPRTFVRPWRLATFNATGAELLKALEKLLFYGGDFFPQVSGLRFRYDSTAAYGHKIVPGSVEVGGLPIEPARLYSFTATEQVWGAMALLLGMSTDSLVTLPTYAFDAVRSYVVSHHELTLGTSGRIRDVAAIPANQK